MASGDVKKQLECKIEDNPQSLLFARLADLYLHEDRIDEVGKIMASFKEVSHCYRRNPSDEWTYNLYTMIHARDEDACRETARKMSKAASVDTYKLLFSRKELKKTSMKYFSKSKGQVFSPK